MPFSEKQLSDIFRFIDPKWKSILITENKTELLRIFDAISTSGALCPLPQNIFNAFRLTPFVTVKVVIIGQDPYLSMEHIEEPNMSLSTANDLGLTDNLSPVAHGLSFSSKSKSIPASLKNIYKCLINSSHIDKMPETSDLTQWATQGVLMINKSLTTVQGKPNSHKQLWSSYTKSIIRSLCQRKQKKTNF